MNALSKILICAPILLLGACATSRRAAPALTPAQVDSLWQSRGCIDDDRGQWFRDAKFGAIIHFGPYSTLGGYYQGKGPYVPSEQIMGLGERRATISPGDYKKNVAANFNPKNFDAAKWVRLMKDAGQKYVILTTKHHDGFCMFKTATTPFNVVDATPFGRDIVQELADECRKQGLIFSPYFSIGDWSASEVQNSGYANYADYMKAQLSELLTNYGDIKLMWFDNWWYVNNQWNNDEPHAKDLYSFIRTASPNTLVSDRCGRGNRSEDGDYATPENQLKGSLQSRYFEVVMTNTDDENWAWVNGARNYRQASDLIKNLIDSTSKGGNFVLNVGPNALGEFPPEHVALLEKFGDWTRMNGEAIYATIPAPHVQCPQSADATAYVTQSKSGDAVYIHVITWPASGPLSIVIKNPISFTAAYLNSSFGRVNYITSHDSVSTTVRIQKPAVFDPSATVIKLSVK